MAFDLSTQYFPNLLGHILVSNVGLVVVLTDTNKAQFDKKVLQDRKIEGLVVLIVFIKFKFLPYTNDLLRELPNEISFRIVA